MSIHYGNTETASIYNKKLLAVGLPYYQQSVSPSVFSCGLVSDGYGLKDGEVPGGSAAYKEAHYSGQTGVTTAAALKAALLAASSDTTIFLENDITLDSSFVPYVGDAESIHFPSGAVLDGCGYTIYIENGDITSTQSGSDVDFGGLMSECQGTIKNLKVYNTSTIHNTQSGEVNKRQSAGLIVGRLQTGTIENCYVTWAGTETFFRNKKSSNSDAILGGVCGRLINGIVKNTTVDLQSTLCVNVRGQGGWNKNWDLMIGGIVGWCQNPNNSGYESNCQIINCTVTGPGGTFSGSGGSSGYFNNNRNNLGLLAWQSESTSGGGYAHAGACIGWLQQQCYIHNFKIGGTFNIITAAQSRRAVGLLVGGGDDRTVGTDPQPTGMEAIFHSSDSNNWFNRFNHPEGEWVQGYPSGAQSTRVPACFYTYNIDENDWGFSKYDEDYIWVGKATSLGGRQLSTPTDVTGAFLNNFVVTTNNVDTTYGAAELFTCPSNMGKAISGILPLSTFVLETPVKGNSGVTLKSLSYGYYGYVANEQGTSAGTYKMYYNNGQNIDYTFERSPIVRIGVYDIYKIQTINNVTYHVTRNAKTGYYSE